MAEGERTLYWRLSAYENLKYFARIYYVPKSEMEKRIEELLKLVGLWERRNDLVMSYSRGMKQRLAIAKALINDPEVLFLDEPTLGLDVQSALFVRDFVKRLVKEEGKTVLLTTHYMVEAEELCDRIAIIDHGRIIALDTPEGLKKLVKDEETVEIAVREFNPALLKNPPGSLQSSRVLKREQCLGGALTRKTFQSWSSGSSKIRLKWSPSRERSRRLRMFS